MPCMTLQLPLPDMPANDSRPTFSTDDRAWRLAWPHLREHMRWCEYASVEGHRSGKLAAWLDTKSAIDGFVLTEDDWLEPYQLKASLTDKGYRQFTVRKQRHESLHRSEWEKLQNPDLFPKWFIKVYLPDPTQNMPGALGVIHTHHLLALIQKGLARTLYFNDGSYWAVQWDDVIEHMTLALEGL